VFQHVAYSINSATSNLANLVLWNFGEAKLKDEKISKEFCYFLFRCKCVLFGQVYPSFPRWKSVINNA
jgi:hypothetical protein